MLWASIMTVQFAAMKLRQLCNSQINFGGRLSRKFQPLESQLRKKAAWKYSSRNSYKALSRIKNIRRIFVRQNALINAKLFFFLLSRERESSENTTQDLSPYTGRPTARVFPKRLSMCVQHILFQQININYFNRRLTEL